MEIRHYIIETSSPLSRLHVYETPVVDKYLERNDNRVIAVSGPATVFVPPNKMVSVLTTQLLGRNNFKDYRNNRRTDKIEITDSSIFPHISKIEIAVLGECDVDGCRELALHQKNINPTSITGRVGHACSEKHLKELGPCGLGETNKPLKELERMGKVIISIE